MAIYLQRIVRAENHNRVAVALGGILIMMGVLLVGTASILGSVNIPEELGYDVLFTWVLVAVSLCDIIAGFFLFFK
jgi:hypothetical protein